MANRPNCTDSLGGCVYFTFSAGKGQVNGHLTTIGWEGMAVFLLAFSREKGGVNARRSAATEGDIAVSSLNTEEDIFMHEWSELIKLWELERLTSEQVIGQLLRHGEQSHRANTDTQRQLEMLV